MSSSFSNLGDLRNDPWLPRLIILGWIVIFLNLPSGFLHHSLGSLVYLRELLFAVHLGASLFWLAKHGQLQWMLRHSWVILIVPIMLAPAAMDPEYRFEALRTCKWSLYWIDWIILGHFLRLNKNWGAWIKVLLACTAVELVAELGAGLWEWHSREYLFKTTWGERTAFGVLKGNDQVLENQMRIRGLQRDVFSFSNLMAMSAVGGYILITLAKNALQRSAAVLCALAFTFMVFISGGRSSIFGVAAAAGYAVFCLFAAPQARKYGVHYVAICVLLASLLSITGVGKFTDFISDTILSSTHVGDSTSAHMRDAFWTKMWSDFGQSPLILFLGGPFTSLLDHKVDIMFHWADNQLLWNLYHTGLAGFSAVLLYFYKVVAPQPTKKDWMVRRGLIFFLVFIIGEGIARESMTFIGCLPLFILCGHYNASQWLQSRGAGSPSVRPSILDRLNT
ncbi:MAG TPA: hypothetical protein VF585_05615 [Chthoniobacterales bacterium]|jgi:hypothetical protein